jgi:site-specific recombinase XerC
MQVEARPSLVATDALLDAYEASLVQERGLNKQTGSVYRHRIELLLHVDGRYRHRREGEPPPRPPFGVTTADLKAHMLERCRKPNTREVARKAFRSFLSWLVEEAYWQDNPALPIRSPKVPKSIPKHLSNKEAAKLEEAAYWEGVSEHALARLYLYSGVRLTEGLNLAWRWPSPSEDPEGICSGVVTSNGTCSGFAARLQGAHGPDLPPTQGGA